MEKMKTANCVQGLIQNTLLVGDNCNDDRWRCEDDRIRCEESNVCLPPAHISLCSGTVVTTPASTYLKVHK